MLWLLASIGLSLYVSNFSNYSATYGSLAGVVVMLLFFYLIGLGLVFGAHLNAALAEPPETALEQAPTGTGAKAAP